MEEYLPLLKVGFSGSLKAETLRRIRKTLEGHAYVANDAARFSEASGGL